MAMYALAIAPLMKKCANDTTQVWYAGDVFAGGTVSEVAPGGKSLLNTVPSLYIFLKQASHRSLSNQVLKQRLLRSLMTLISLLPMREERIWESLWVLLTTAIIASVIRSRNGASKWKTWRSLQNPNHMLLSPLLHMVS